MTTPSKPNLQRLLSALLLATLSASSCNDGSLGRVYMEWEHGLYVSIRKVTWSLGSYDLVAVLDGSLVECQVEVVPPPSAHTPYDNWPRQPVCDSDDVELYWAHDPPVGDVSPEGFFVVLRTPSDTIETVEIRLYDAAASSLLGQITVNPTYEPVPGCGCSLAVDTVAL